MVETKLQATLKEHIMDNTVQLSEEQAANQSCEVLLTRPTENIRKQLGMCPE